MHAMITLAHPKMILRVVSGMVPRGVDTKDVVKEKIHVDSFIPSFSKKVYGLPLGRFPL